MKKLNVCEEFGVSFRKPAHLKQHMQSHSLEVIAILAIEGSSTCHAICFSTYEGKLFECPNCKSRFAFQANMKRHVREFHEEFAYSDIEVQKQFVCREPGCGKAFQYASKLQKHEDSHVHLQSCHRHIACEIYGSKQLKKNIKRHLLSHEEGVSSERIKCTFEDCLRTFSIVRLLSSMESCLA